MASFLHMFSSLALLVALASTASSETTTTFSYDFINERPAELTYQGDAHFPTDSMNLRLTKTNASGYPQPYSAGRVMYTPPIKFWESGVQIDFETIISFIITSVDKNPGDGLVFFIAPVGSTIPTGYSGGNFGVFTTSVGVNPSIFAVEFDTFSNSYDPPYRHIGIDIEHQASSNTTRVDDAILGDTVTAHITYVQATKMITARVLAGSQDFEVSYVFDLSTVLNQQVQVGLAATTGGSVSNHDVILWDFTATLADNTVGPPPLPKTASQ